MDNNLSNFERSLRDSYESFEVPFDQSSWTAMENRLKSQSSANSGGNTTVFVAAAVLLAVIGSMFFLTVWSPLLKEQAGLPAELQPSKQQLAPATADSTPSISADQENESVTSNPAEDSLTASSDFDSDSSSGPVSSKNTGAINNKASQKSKAASADFSSESSDEQAGSAEDVSSGVTADDMMSKDANALIIGASTTTGCAGESVVFTVQSGTIDGKYLWNFGDGSFSSHPNPVHGYTKPGSYHVTLSVTSSTDGQIRTQTLNKSIVIYPAPEARFDWEFINAPSEAPEVKFINRSEKAREAHWIIGKEETEDINPSVIFPKKGEYPIKLMVSNDYGCTDSVYQVVRINDNYNLLAPEAFSPNGDGLNDTFLPEALKMRNVKFKMTVYHNNKPIFETSDRFEPWKGVLPGGILAASGSVFPWVVQLTNESGLEEYYSGTVTVIP